MTLWIDFYHDIIEKSILNHFNCTIDEENARFDHVDIITSSLECFDYIFIRVIIDRSTLNLFRPSYRRKGMI